MKPMRPRTPKLRMRALPSTLSLAAVIRVDEQTQRVDGMTLHEWLGVKSAFRHWVKRRVEDCRLVEGLDYYAVKSDRGGIIEAFEECWFTLDAAKLISMIERTDRGDEARRYFVEVERRFLRVRDELIPQLQAKIHSLESMLRQVTEPKVRKRAGQFFVTAWEKITLTDIFGLVSERLVKVRRPYAELSEAQRAVYQAQHRQATMTGLSKAQSEALSKLTLVPSAGLLPARKDDDSIQ